MKINSTQFSNIAKKLGVSFVKHGPITLVPNPASSDGLYYPQRNYDNKRNHPLLPGISMDTPFCKFQPDLPSVSGVYIWVDQKTGEIEYIGEALDLRSRFNTGYGNISPRNPFVGGQSTNVRMNRFTLQEYQKGNIIEIYYTETDKRKELEAALISSIKPAMNIQLV